MTYKIYGNTESKFQHLMVLATILMMVLTISCKEASQPVQTTDSEKNTASNLITKINAVQTRATVTSVENSRSWKDRPLVQPGRWSPSRSSVVRFCFFTTLNLGMYRYLNLEVEIAKPHTISCMRSSTLFRAAQCEQNAVFRSGL